MQTIHLFWILIFLLGFTTTRAQNGTPMNAGARGAALGQSGVALDGIWGGIRNQAVLALLEKPVAGLLAENRFLLNEIKSLGAIAAIPTGFGAFGLQLQYFGFEQFNEQKIGLAYGRKLLENFSIGAQVDFVNTTIPDYGNKGVLTFELGIFTQLSPGLDLGIHAYSPVRVESVAGENLPTVVAAGFGYHASDKLLIIGEIEKDIDYQARIKVGVEYLPVPTLALRTGVSTNPTSLSFGAGLKIQEKFVLDIASNYHQVLGFSPGIGFLIEL